MIHAVQTELSSVSDDLLKITEVYSQNERLIASFEKGNREELLKAVKEIYPRLEAEHQLSVFEFGDASGTVLLNGVIILKNMEMTKAIYKRFSPL